MSLQDGSIVSGVPVVDTASTETSLFDRLGRFTESLGSIALQVKKYDVERSLIESEINGDITQQRALDGSPVTLRDDSRPVKDSDTTKILIAGGALAVVAFIGSRLL